MFGDVARGLLGLIWGDAMSGIDWESLREDMMALRASALRIAPSQSTPDQAAQAMDEIVKLWLDAVRPFAAPAHGKLLVQIERDAEKILKGPCEPTDMELVRFVASRIVQDTTQMLTYVESTDPSQTLIALLTLGMALSELAIRLDPDKLAGLSLRISIASAGMKIVTRT